MTRGVINLLMAFKSYLKDSCSLHISTSSSHNQARDRLTWAPPTRNPMLTDFLMKEVMQFQQSKSKKLWSHMAASKCSVPYVVQYPESASKFPTPRIPDEGLLYNYQYSTEGLKV